MKTLPSLADRTWIAARIVTAVENCFPHERPQHYKDGRAAYALFTDVSEAVDRRSFVEHCQRFLAALSNGHTSFSDNSSFRPQIGFYARPLDGSWTVIRTRRPDLSPGDRIVALDGTPIEQVVVALMPLMSASRCEAARASVLFYTHLLPSEASHWKTADGRNVPFTHPLAPVQVEGATLRVVADGTALLRFPNCTPETITEVSALLDDAPPYHNLIVDLRGNGGGHTPVDVIQRLVRGTWQSWAVESVQYEGLALANGENGRFIVRRPSFRLDANPRAFDGPLVILADTLTGSAAEDFIMAIRCSDRRLPAILIGEVTAGTTGQPYFEEFGDELSMRVAAKACLLPSGEAFEGIGFSPDILVEPTPASVAAGTDRALEAALKMLKIDEDQH